MPAAVKVLLFVALVVAIAYASVFFGIGRLPGDIVIDRGNGFYFYLPITSSIVVSVILSLGLWLFRR
jgi:hypothetical protein